MRLASRSTLAAAGASLLGLVAFASGDAIAAFPGENGRIAYDRSMYGEPPSPDSSIFTIRPDGSDVRQLTDSPGDSRSPSWSPDGLMLVFARGAKDRTSIWTMNADGSEQNRVIASDDDQDESFYASPSFSPNGRRIIYSTLDSIRSVRVDGSDPRRILTLPARSKRNDALVHDPVFSPDGERIAFARGLSWGSSNGIWVMRPNGSHLRRLTKPDRPSWDEAPDYSPDGRHIVFKRRSDEIVLMRADGRRERPLQGQLPNSFDPAYAPAGDLLVATRVVAFSKVDTCADLYTSSPFTPGTNVITDNCPPSGPYVTSPDWQPLPAP